MRKVMAVMAAAALAVCCVGCAKTISGTPSSVISQAQSAGDSFDVEVTGYIMYVNEDNNYLALSDHQGGLGDGIAWCHYDGDDPIYVEGQHITAKGTYGGYVSDSRIEVKKCTFKTA